MLLYMRALCLAICFSVLSGGGPLQALEVPYSTADMARASDHVAHVRLVATRSLAGSGLFEYDLAVLESYRGQLPAEIRIRVLVTAPALQQHSGPMPEGSEMVVMLTSRSEEGIYPLHSLQWGILPVVETAQGQRLIGRAVSGFSQTRLSLDMFQSEL